MKVTFWKLSTWLCAAGMFTVTACQAGDPAEGVVRITDTPTAALATAAPGAHVEHIRLVSCGTSADCGPVGSPGICSLNGCGPAPCATGSCAPLICDGNACGCEGVCDGGCQGVSINMITLNECCDSLFGCNSCDNDCWLDRCGDSALCRWWHKQSLMYQKRNRMTSKALICGLCPTGCCETALAGKYHIVYTTDPNYADQRDGGLYSAQGYGVPVTVPLAPNVRHTYNYGWGIPSSRLTPISHPVP